MTATTTVHLHFGDGQYHFFLGGKQIEELQIVCGAGLGTIYKRVIGGDWYYSDLVNIIRLGLIGGGTGPIRAKQLVDAYVDGQPIALTENCPLSIAIAVLTVCFAGLPKEDNEKKKKMTTGS